MKRTTTVALLLLFVLAALVAWVAADEQAPLVLAVIGDYGSGTPRETAVAAMIHGWDVDAVLTVGDNNYPAGAAQTIGKNIGRDYGRYVTDDLSTNRFWPTLGNHDIKTQRGRPYLDYFTLPGNERWYSVSYADGAIALWALDSTKLNDEQLNWIEDGLTTSPACFDIVYFHHAPFSSGKHGGTKAMRLPFAEWGGDLVMSGHDHTYERLEIDGIAYFVNGLGGKGMYPWGDPDAFTEAASQARFRDSNGAMRLTITGDLLTAEFLALGGHVIDTYQLQKDCGN